ncbi:hypothetical protein A0J61_10618 [Choanephora cucurbitarum]|uniref:Uncharacterized protein n=1 Tax=Choanephora cucurbitarum TaxID=101091 RepID=A0A1C7MWZ4_9FUNG|nr:hypothetical protein A0J61_10618 [Choanephora cucurbitarum]
MSYYNRGHGPRRGGFRGNHRNTRGGMYHHYQPMSEQERYESFYLPSFTQDPWQHIEHPESRVEPVQPIGASKDAFYLPSFTQDPWQHLQ